MIGRLILAAALLCGPEVSAQVEGRVRTARGEPLPGAEVVLWGRGEELGAVVSGQQGHFQSEISRDSLRRISVHYLGFGTEMVSGDRLGPGPVEVRLTPLPVPLPEIAVFITRDICGEPEDTDARRLWEAARSPYRKDTGSRGGLAWGQGLEMDVPADRLGDYRDDRLVVWGRGWGRWPAGEEDRQGTLEDRVREGGYAWRPPGRSTSGTERRHRNWSYPEFEQRHAYHFVTDQFGSRHTLHRLNYGNETMEIAFCPADRSQPWMQGRLVLSPDSSFVEARWSIHTGEPREGAGGEVLFADAYDAAGGRHLVAARGVFWRHDGQEPPYPDLPRDYYQLILVNSGWVINTTELRPDCRYRMCGPG